MFYATFVYLKREFYYRLGYSYESLCDKVIIFFILLLSTQGKIEEIQHYLSGCYCSLKDVNNPVFLLQKIGRWGGMQSPAKNSTYHKIQRNSFKLQKLQTSFLLRVTLFLKITYNFEKHICEKNHRPTFSFQIHEVLRIHFCTKHRFNIMSFTLSNRLLIFHGFISQSKPNTKTCLLT